jgi:regulator of cell morphogenesis and NO signaling
MPPITIRRATTPLDTTMPKRISINPQRLSSVPHQPLNSKRNNLRKKAHDMAIEVDSKMTVRELVGRCPQTRPVFEKLGIDYCCGGGKCLSDVAGEHGLKLPALVEALETAIQTPPGKAEATDKDWYAAPLGELVKHIVEVHHGYMHTALPRLRSLVTTVIKAHGAQHGDMLGQVKELFEALDTELSSHLLKEEQVLFPYIVALEMHRRQGEAKPQACFGSLQNPIRQMEHEHESAGGALIKLREATYDYALPPDACPTFRAMYEELQRMEADLHQHIHLENNILFPRAIESEG